MSDTTKKTGQGRKYKGPIAIGLNKGFRITKKKPAVRPSTKRGLLSKRVKFVREIIKEVSGLAPYERRILDLLRNGLDKRALKLATKKLGTFSRGKSKREAMGALLLKQRQEAARLAKEKEAKRAAAKAKKTSEKPKETAK